MKVVGAIMAYMLLAKDIFILLFTKFKGVIQKLGTRLQYLPVKQVYMYPLSTPFGKPANTRVYMAGY